MILASIYWVLFNTSAPPARIDEAIAANKFNQLRLIDRISVKDPEYEALDVIDQELFLQADSSDFQTVINRLENKG